jgi:chromosome segregation ATPase
MTIYCHKERLRKAIEDFSQRIIPLFEEVELGRKRIQELEEQQHSRFHDLTAKARRVDSLQKEIAGLRKSKEELESNCMEALDSADALRIKAEEFQSSLVEVRENLATKEDENRRVVDSLNRFKSSVRPIQHLHLMKRLKKYFITGHIKVEETQSSQARSR